MNPLLQKLQKNTTIKQTSILSESTIFNHKDMIVTHIPALNIALSGKIDGGFTSGITTISGVSKNFKCLSGHSKLVVFGNSKFNPEFPNHFENFDKIETNYATLFNLMSEYPEKEFYVETVNHGLTKILASVKKESTMLYVEFDNKNTVHCSTEHHFMNSRGEAIAAQDLIVGDFIQSVFGLVEVTNIVNSTETECYDIAIESPHWYINDETGIIHHNTGFSLVLAKAFLDKYTDGIILFYDSEFGCPQSYFETFGLDTNKILHTPITDIEELTFDIMKQLESIERNDHVMIIVDSIGNMASKKEKTDALDGKSVTDMTRAKSLKSLFRMVTPHLNIKDIPMVVINHVYQTMEFISRTVVGGGCVVAGTKIQLADGELKKVEDFQVGDLVKTLVGNKKVTAIWNPDSLIDGTPECYEIEFIDGYKVICSDKHRFLIDEEWDNADDWMEAENLFPNLSVKKIDDAYLPIEKVTYIGNENVYDLSIEDVEHYILENGVVTHNTGSVYSSDTIFIIGRQQDKDGTELSGYNFIINIEKSRFVREKSKIPINVSFEFGIDRYSGLIDIAVEGGFVEKGRFGKSLGYAFINQETGEIGPMLPIKKTQNDEFWNPILHTQKFKEYVKKQYEIAYGSILGETEILDETGENENA